MKVDEFNQFYQSLLLHPTGISLKSYVEVISKLFFDIVLPIIIVTFYLAQSLLYLAPILNFATEAIKIDFNHINPISGFKNI